MVRSHDLPTAHDLPAVLTSDFLAITWNVQLTVPFVLIDVGKRIRLVESINLDPRRLGPTYHLIKAAALLWLVMPQTKVVAAISPTRLHVHQPELRPCVFNEVPHY
jgi:hypothetical protein